jgi:hypothetical protein
MKQSIFDEGVQKEIAGRIAKLNVDSKGQWCKLNSVQMLRHLTEGARMAFDEVVVPDQSTFITKSLVKWLFLSNVKPPGREKGKIKTFAEIDIVALGTVCDAIETEKNNYLKIIQRIASAGELSRYHPLFGKMSRKDWGFLTYAHADYHLTQFGV